MATETSPVLGLIRHLADARAPQPADAELLRRFNGLRDEAAFRALVARHGAMVFDVCRNVLGNEANAEDAFQATFLVLAQKAKSIRKRASVGSWLYGVAYRTACRARVRAARRQKHEAAAPGAARELPADDVSWREVQGVLHDELSRIPGCYQAPLVLCYLEGHTQDEAARQLGVSKDTVKKRLERGRTLLRQRLLRRGLGPAALVLAASWPFAQASGLPAAEALTAMVKAATLVAAKQPMAGLVSAKVAALSHGVMKTMLLAKATTLAAGGLAAGLLVTATLAAGIHWLPESPSGEQPALVKGVGAPKPVARPKTAEALPAAVRQALESNARAFAPLALTTHKQRSFPDPQAKEAKQYLASVPGVLKPCTYDYLAQDGLCYARFNMWVQARNRIGDTEQWTDWFLSPVWQVFSWDGKCAYRENQSTQPMIIEVVPIEKAESDYLGKVPWYEQDDYLGMIGIAAPRLMKELPRGPQSEILRLLEGDGRVTAVESKRFPGQKTDALVVELRVGGKKHRFWLDPALGYAVRRYELWTPSDALMLVMENSEFVKLTGPELWLPRHCRAERFNNAGTRPLIVTELRATRLERTRVSAEKFAVKFEPGSVVADARLPSPKQGKGDRVSYRVPDNPAELKGTIQAAQAGQAYVPPSRFLALWIVGGGLLLLLVAAGFFYLLQYRRRVRAKSNNPPAPKATG